MSASPHFPPTTRAIPQLPPRYPSAWPPSLQQPPSSPTCRCHLLDDNSPGPCPSTPDSSSCPLNTRHLPSAPKQCSALITAKLHPMQRQALSLPSLPTPVNYTTAQQTARGPLTLPTPTHGASARNSCHPSTSLQEPLLVLSPPACRTQLGPSLLAGSAKATRLATFSPVSTLPVGPG